MKFKIIGSILAALIMGLAFLAYLATRETGEATYEEVQQ